MTAGTAAQRPRFAKAPRGRFTSRSPSRAAQDSWFRIRLRRPTFTVPCAASAVLRQRLQSHRQFRSLRGRLFLPLQHRRRLPAPMRRRQCLCGPLALAAQPPAMAARPIAPSAPAPPSAPLPRMIVPQTGPRPVYKAPLRPAPPPAAPGAPAAPPASGSGASGARPADFSASSSGRADGNRPPLRPGERRPMHPTRQSPTGTRPLGVGPGRLPPAGRRPSGQPARRTVAPSRPALCSAWHKRRPDEGLHSAAAAVALQ